MQEPKFKVGETAWAVVEKESLVKCKVTQVIQKTNGLGTKETYDVILFESDFHRNYESLLTQAEAIEYFDKQRSAQFLKLFG